MKSEILAFILNFFLPGAGLAYLGLYRSAVLNFLFVVVIAFALGMYLDPQMLTDGGAYIGAAIAGGSGGFAMSKAREMNLEMEEAPNSSA